MVKSDIQGMEFPQGWKKLKNQPLPEEPQDLEKFLNSVEVSQEELLRGRPIAKKFVLPLELLGH